MNKEHTNTFNTRKPPPHQSMTEIERKVARNNRNRAHIKPSLPAEKPELLVQRCRNGQLRFYSRNNPISYSAALAIWDKAPKFTTDKDDQVRAWSEEVQKLMDRVRKTDEKDNLRHKIVACGTIKYTLCSVAATNKKKTGKTPPLLERFRFDDDGQVLLFKDALAAWKGAGAHPEAAFDLPDRKKHAFAYDRDVGRLRAFFANVESGAISGEASCVSDVERITVGLCRLGGYRFYNYKGKRVARAVAAQAFAKSGWSAFILGEDMAFEVEDIAQYLSANDDSEDGTACDIPNSAEDSNLPKPAAMNVKLWDKSLKQWKKTKTIDEYKKNMELFFTNRLYIPTYAGLFWESGGDNPDVSDSVVDRFVALNNLGFFTFESQEGTRMELEKGKNGTATGLYVQRAYVNAVVSPAILAKLQKMVKNHKRLRLMETKKTGETKEATEFINLTWLEPLGSNGKGEKIISVDTAVPVGVSRDDLASMSRWAPDLADLLHKQDYRSVLVYDDRTGTTGMWDELLAALRV